MYASKDIESILKKSSEYLDSQIEVFLIGGCAMTFRNLKAATKDADLLVEDDLTEKKLFNAMRDAGLKELFPGAYTLDLKAKDILITNNCLQFDLFSKNVLGGLSLSTSMKKRATLFATYGKLNLFLLSKEDIYLFKAITTRPFPRDYEDLLILQQSSLNWKEVILEFERQIKGTKLEENLRSKLLLLKQNGVINPLITKLKV